MRYLPALVLASVASLAQGTTLEDFAGAWKGQRYEWSNGVQYLMSERGTYAESGGSLVGKFTISYQGIALKAQGTYGADGSYSAVLQYGSRVLAVSTGRWNLAGNTIIVHATSNEVGVGKVSGRATLQLVNPRTLVNVSILNAGTVSFKLRKVR